MQNNQQMPLNPWGVLQGSLDEVIPLRSIIHFKKSNSGIYAAAKSLNEKYKKLYLEMCRDPGRSPKEKTAILAKVAKTDLKTFGAALNNVAEKAQNTSKSILDRAHKPTDTTENKETRSILRNANVKGLDALTLARKDDKALYAMLTSPLPMHDFDLSEAQYKDLQAELTLRQIGPDYDKMLQSDSEHDNAKRAFEALNTKLGGLISKAKENQYNLIDEAIAS